jgi:hypothetical protein
MNRDMDFYRNNFTFHASRYEEWMNGHCIGSGSIATEIVAEASKTDIRFYISDPGNLEINNFSVYDFSDETTELVLDRIIYSHESISPEPNEPVECQLFRTGSTISGIRFTMLNPLRVIEFYGNVVEIGQPSRHAYKESGEIKTAASIISDLKATCRYDADELMKAAVKQFELYSDASTPNEIKGIVESLKLFVGVYQMLIEQTYDEGRTHMLLPKVYFFIALCNLKLCNINQAYAVAQEGLIKVDEVIRESLFANLPPDLIGGEDLKELVSNIEKAYPGVKTDYNSNSVNPCIIDTSIVESVEKNNPDKFRELTIEDIEKVHDRLCFLQTSLLKLFEKTNNKKVIDAKNNIDIFKYPLYVAWELFDSNFYLKVDQQDIDSLNYQNFKNDIKLGIHELILELEEESLFQKILKNDDMTDRLISVYKFILQEIESHDYDVVNNSTTSSLVSQESVSAYDNIPAIFIKKSAVTHHSGNNISSLVELPDMFIFDSNEHQRYEYGEPVMGIQKCLRTIKVEVNKNGCAGYNIEPGDGYIVSIINNDTINAQMSAKPMRLVQVTDSSILLQGYPLFAFSPFGWQPVDYSSYGFSIHFANGVVTHCDLHMLDRNVRIEYRLTEQNKLSS